LGLGHGWVVIRRAKVEELVSLVVVQKVTLGTLEDEM
jgi:hypothetical protein